MNILIIAIILVVGYLLIQSFAAKLSEENLSILKKMFISYCFWNLLLHYCITHIVNNKDDFQF